MGNSCSCYHFCQCDKEMEPVKELEPIASGKKESIKFYKFI